MSMLVQSHKIWSFWKECFAVFGVIIFVTICFPNVVLHPTTVFGYGGGGGGGGTTPTTPVLSSQKNITTFEISGQVGETVIDTDALVIRVTMPYGTDLSAVTPNIVLSGGTVSPASGETVDFTRSRTYTVTASDLSTKTYTVFVDLAPRHEVEDPNSVWFQETVEYTDMVRDGEIDILDFNTLMVHWSDSSINNPADVNHDQSVDVFDFNLLMVHWGKLEF